MSSKLPFVDLQRAQGVKKLGYTDTDLWMVLSLDRLRFFQGAVHASWMAELRKIPHDWWVDDGGCHVKWTVSSWTSTHHFCCHFSGSSTINVIDHFCFILLSWKASPWTLDSQTTWTTFFCKQSVHPHVPSFSPRKIWRYICLLMCFPMIPSVSMSFLLLVQVLDPRIGAHHCAHQLGQGGDVPGRICFVKERWVYTAKMGWLTWYNCEIDQMRWVYRGIWYIYIYIYIYAWLCLYFILYILYM